jgi:hypothetical protein
MFRNFRKHKNNQRGRFGISESIKTTIEIISEIPKAQKQSTRSFRNFRKHKNNQRDRFGNSESIKTTNGIVSEIPKA